MAFSGTIVKCKLCGELKKYYCRGLCCYCYRSSDRNLFQNYRAGNGGYKAKRRRSLREADQPTSAPPGSEAKIAILARRFQRRMCLWHPLDFRRYSDQDLGRVHSSDDED